MILGVPSQQKRLGSAELNDNSSIVIFYYVLNLRACSSVCVRACVRLFASCTT